MTYNQLRNERTTWAPPFVCTRCCTGLREPVRWASLVQLLSFAPVSVSAAFQLQISSFPLEPNKERALMLQFSSDKGIGAGSFLGHTCSGTENTELRANLQGKPWREDNFEHSIHLINEKLRLNNAAKSINPSWSKGCFDALFFCGDAVLLLVSCTQSRFLAAHAPLPSSIISQEWCSSPKACTEAHRLFSDFFPLLLPVARSQHFSKGKITTALGTEYRSSGTLKRVSWNSVWGLHQLHKVYLTGYIWDYPSNLQLKSWFSSTWVSAYCLVSV